MKKQANSVAKQRGEPGKRGEGGRDIIQSSRVGDWGNQWKGRGKGGGGASDTLLPGNFLGSHQNSFPAFPQRKVSYILVCSYLSI